MPKITTVALTPEEEVIYGKNKVWLLKDGNRSGYPFVEGTVDLIQAGKEPEPDDDGYTP